MKKLLCPLLLAALLTGCIAPAENHSPAGTDTETASVTEPATAPPVEVVEEGMTPVYADSLKDGSYEVTVDSSSTMFQITACTLTVENGTMSAVLTMGGTGYLYVYPGTADEAANAAESDRIPFAETADGAHTFTVPVEGLDMGIPLAAYSKKKELWYDRTILFRADSLPAGAFAEGYVSSAEDLGLADGTYTVAVTVSGGSGRANVQSPTKLTVTDGKAFAEIVWGSPNYDYMTVDGERFEPDSLDPVSVFTIPVNGFGYPMPVTADTTAMSTPYEIEYTLTFDPSTIQ